ncbi:hypothetical protein Glove_85g130 [Diversispora epigaea]|uniref:Uncharacterized protein n=1 Tax=Diversispora epigaea TaxID=1348612 RepID=A0A397JG01_9GLOM|nr:hypothetical protein Glove_85g130 [Diversispora epigaea]
MDNNFSLASSVSVFGTFTHNETIPYPNAPRMWQYGEYFDGTVVIRIINRDSTVNSTNTSEVWVKKMLSLRILHPNGTVSEIEKDLGIQDFNWKIVKSPNGNDFLDPISIYSLHKGFVLVRYFNASNPDDINTYEELGRIIDWNGNLYSEVNFRRSYIENGIWYPTGTAIVTNVDPSKGFMRTAGRNASYVEWQQYMIDDSFNLKILSQGVITLPQEDVTSAMIITMATVDEGYSIIIGNSINTTESNPLQYGAALYDLTIGYSESQFSLPKLLYQILLPNITFSNMFCGISSSCVGQVCTLNVIQRNATNSTDYYMQLNFLSSGSVVDVTPISRNLSILPSNSTTRWQVENIPYGGYLFYGYFLDASSQTNAYVYYFDESSPDSIAWEHLTQYCHRNFHPTYSLGPLGPLGPLGFLDSLNSLGPLDPLNPLGTILTTLLIIDEIISELKLKIHLHKVKAHTGNFFNEMADSLAKIPFTQTDQEITKIKYRNKKNRSYIPIWNNIPMEAPTKLIKKRQKIDWYITFKTLYPKLPVINRRFQHQSHIYKDSKCVLCRRYEENNLYVFECKRNNNDSEYKPMIKHYEKLIEYLTDKTYKKKYINQRTFHHVNLYDIIRELIPHSLIRSKIKVREAVFEGMVKKRKNKNNNNNNNINRKENNIDTELNEELIRNKDDQTIAREKKKEKERETEKIFEKYTVHNLETWIKYGSITILPDEVLTISS